MTHVRTRPKPLCSLPLRRSRTLPADLVLNPLTIRRTFSLFSLLLINNVITYAAFEVSVEVIHNDTNESCSDVTENLQKNPHEPNRTPAAAPRPRPRPSVERRY